MTHRSRRIAPVLLAGASLLLTPAAEARITIDDGHVDAVAARVVGGKLRAFVKDESRGQAVWRRPGSVVLRVSDRARVRLPRGLGAVGRAGQTAWIAPQTQRRGILWAGWSTQAVGRSVRWAVRGVSGPGRMVLFQTGSFGSANVLFSSARRMPQRLTIPARTHAHGNWAFTRPGVYKLRYTLSAGRQRARATLTFRVG